MHFELTGFLVEVDLRLELGPFLERRVDLGFDGLLRVLAVQEATRAALRHHLVAGEQHYQIVKL